MYKCLPSLERIKDKPWAGEESGAADNLWWYQWARAGRIVNERFEQLQAALPMSLDGLCARVSALLEEAHGRD
jgi:hypothetical protein